MGHKTTQLGRAMLTDGQAITGYEAHEMDATETYQTNEDSFTFISCLTYNHIEP
jgi:hypothetical protein